MRKIITLLIAFSICSALALVVFAHSGDTDINGGHTDHDTGEYHYHHGYPAHDHYDMDGDGDLDCPYNFKDNTSSSGSSSGSIWIGKGDQGSENAGNPWIASLLYALITIILGIPLMLGPMSDNDPYEYLGVSCLVYAFAILIAYICFMIGESLFESRLAAHLSANVLNCFLLYKRIKRHI